MVIYLAGLQGIPTELYEAAQVDGAKSVRRFFNITLPLLTPVLFFQLIIGIIRSLQVFVKAFIMTDGGPAGSDALLCTTSLSQRISLFSDGLRLAAGLGPLPYVSFLTMLVFRSAQFVGLLRVGGKKRGYSFPQQNALGERDSIALAHRRRRLTRRLQRSAGVVAVHLALIPLAVLFMLPLAWMLSTRSKIIRGLRIPSPVDSRPIRWDNYVQAMTVLPFGRFFLNTSFLTFRHAWSIVVLFVGGFFLCPGSLERPQRSSLLCSLP